MPLCQSAPWSHIDPFLTPLLLLPNIPTLQFSTTPENQKKKVNQNLKVSKNPKRAINESIKTHSCPWIFYSSCHPFADQTQGKQHNPNTNAYVCVFWVLRKRKMTVLFWGGGHVKVFMFYVVVGFFIGFVYFWSWADLKKQLSQFPKCSSFFGEKIVSV